MKRGRWIALVVLMTFGLLGWQTLVSAQKKKAADQQAAADGAAQKAKKKQQQAAAKAKPADDAHPVNDAPATATTTPTGPWLSSGDSYDDFCSVAQAKDGTLYAAYAAYYDEHDQIRVHKRLESGKWSTRIYVPLVETTPDIWMPQLAVDAQDRLWVIWSEQTGRSERAAGNWDLYARSFDGNKWGPLVRLTQDPLPDINHHVHTDRDGVIHVVWQAHPKASGVIQRVKFDGDKWSKPLAITTGSGSDWYPQVAVDKQGTEWIVFDSYRNGDYDVFLTSVRGDEVGQVVPIATSHYYEAHPSVACTDDGRVWVSWERGGWLWGKDQGHWLQTENRNVGTPLGAGRAVFVAAYDGDRVLAAPKLPELLDDSAVPLPKNARGGFNNTAMGALAADKDGRVWLSYRQQRRGGVRNARGQFKRYWTDQVTYLTNDGWAEPQELPDSEGRISVFSRVLPAADGGLHVAYNGDMRGPADYHQPIRDRALVFSVPKPEGNPGTPELAKYEAPEPPANARDTDMAGEREDVARIRAFRFDIGGTEHRIVRGDMHRHSEMSWDVGPSNDGAYLDFYRYMIDVASMDFGGLTDHQGGGHYAYHWWLTQKSADLYHLPPRFVPLFAYERSVKFPNGHRNVLHAQRGVPVFPFQTRLGQTGVFPGVSSDVIENDTKLLYEFLHKTGGICISHTSATDTMGTDWRDNDPTVEPVVEIYQGARNSSEVVGGPRVHPIDKEPASKAPGGYQEAGMLWNAWGKGYRLGNTSSSDHGSTHISYSLVYVPKLERQALIDSIRARQTYGATDNVIVTCTADGHFMGEEYTTAKPPVLKLSVRGTDKIDRVDLIRDATYVYASSPHKAEIDITYTDMAPKAGTSYYYFRLVQENGEVAWASPVWVNYQP